MRNVGTTWASLLSAYVLSLAVMAIPVPAYAQTSSDPAKDAARAIGMLERLLYRTAELCEQYCEAAQVGADIIDRVQFGFDALNSDAVFFNQELVDALHADAERLRQLGAEPPPFEIYTPDRVIALESGDPEAMTRAFDAMVQDRAEYEDKLERWLEKRGHAQAIFDEANAMSYRAGLVDDRLGALLNTTPGWFLNIFARLDLARLDLNISLDAALTDRLNASQELLQKYDRSIATMKANLDSTRDLSAWSWFLHGQGFTGAPVEASQNPLDVLKTPVSKEKIETASSIFDNLSSIETVSQQETRLRELLHEMNVTNTEVIEAAAKLWREAAEKDEEARRAALIRAVLTAAADGVGKLATQSSSPGMSEPQPYGSTIYFEQTWQIDVSADGSAQMRFVKRGAAVELKKPN